MSKPDNETFFKQRQQLIISAAKNCFSRSGFHGASMADISRESGLGAGQLYRYFNSKEVIVSETIKSIAENWRTFLLHSLAHETHTANIIDTDSPFWQNWSPEDRVYYWKCIPKPHVMNQCAQCWPARKPYWSQIWTGYSGRKCRQKVHSSAATVSSFC